MRRTTLRALGSAAVAIALAAFATAEEAAPSIDKLIQQLASAERDARREAALQLERSGTAALPALPALIKAINDDDKQVATSALASIAALGPQAQEAIPALIASLDTRKSRGRDRRQVVMRAAYALSRIGSASVTPLIAAIAQDDIGLRIGGAHALGGLGPQAKDAVPGLIQLLVDGREPIREEVIQALGLIGPEAGPALVTALTDGDARRRSGAALALAQIEPAYRQAAQPVEQQLARETEATARAALLTALPKVGAAPDRCVALLLPGVTDDNESTRHAALNALLGTWAVRAAAVPKLVTLLKDGKPEVRERAARALGRMGSDAASALPALLAATRAAGGAQAFADALAQIGPQALPALLDALQKGKPEESAWILRALRGFGPPAIPVLNEALKHPSAAVRAAAAGTLGSMGREAADAINPLFVLTEDASPEVQAASLRALVALRADSNRLKPLLQTALASKHADVRKAGAAGTAAFGGAAQLGVNGLLDLLDDDDAAGRVAAVQALGQLGAQAAPAVDALAARLGDPALQSLAMEALGKIGPAAAPAVPRLLDAAKNTDQRASVLPTLTAIGKGATPALPKLYEWLDDPAGDVRAATATAIAAVETDAAKALAVLIPLAADQSGRMRRAAALGLTRYGEAASAAVPALVRMLPSPNERSEAMRALKAIGVRTVPELKTMLAINDARVRNLACESLGALGPAAKDAAPKLRELAEQNNEVRNAARAALARIEAPAPQ